MTPEAMETKPQEQPSEPGIDWGTVAEEAAMMVRLNRRGASPSTGDTSKGAAPAAAER